MVRSLIVVSRLLLYVVALCLSVPALAQQSQQPASSDPIRQTNPALAASALQVHGDCDRVNAGLPLARFSWTAAKGYSSRQRVDITPYRGGFDSGKFQTIGVTKGKNPILVWRGGEAGINYYWRVLTATPAGWVASETARYEVPTCPVDFETPAGKID